MIKSVTIALALALSSVAASAHAQIADSYAAREARAREVVMPEFQSGIRMVLKDGRDQMPVDLLAPEEARAFIQAYDRETEILIDTYGQRFAAIVARHVPIDQIQPGADYETPEWTAVMEEVRVLAGEDAVRDGMKMAAKVIKIGCTVNPTPSDACVTLLESAERFNNGQIKPEDALAR